MPGLDRTGPMGMGSMTGWGRGRCAKNAGGVRDGFGFGRGRGRGRRWWNGGFSADSPVPASTAGDMQQEMEWMKNQIQMLTRAVEELGARMQPKTGLEGTK